MTVTVNVRQEGKVTHVANFWNSSVKNSWDDSTDVNYVNPGK